MRLRVSLLVSLACLFAMAAPALAKTLSTHVDLYHQSKILKLELKPGRYRFVANEASGQVKVIRNYKVIGTVKGRWVKLNKKSYYSEIVSSHNDIQEIYFSGKKEAVKFAS
ncbi:MAG: hypothetical protein KGL59_02285 [Acidobacteriota bacterium]|nr:hypothetical protein [Acidobacteriota bacterium]